MAGTKGAEHYNTPGVEVDEFPQAPARTRNTFWTEQLDLLKSKPNTVLKYAGAKASSGSNLKRKDYHIEFVVRDGDLYVRWNPNAKAPEPKPESNGTSNGTTSEDKPKVKAKANAGS